MKIHLGAWSTLQCLLDALINAWLLYSRAPCGTLMKHCVHGATEPAYRRLTSPMRKNQERLLVLDEPSLHAVTPSVNPTACLFRHWHYKPELGHMYFHINLIACTVVHGAKIWRSGDLFVGSRIKASGFPDWLLTAYD